MSFRGSLHRFVPGSRREGAPRSSSHFPKGPGRRLAALSVITIAVMFAETACAPSAEAGVKVTKSVSHYDIRGNTARQLQRAMDRRGPVDRNDGSRQWAQVNWYVNWKYRYKSDAKGCRITSVDTSVAVKYTMPRWRNIAAGGATLRRSWRRTMAALRKHEDRHAGHGIAAARDIDAAIARMKPRKTCKALGRAANVLGKRIVKRYNSRDVAYDKSTRHGATEIPALRD